MKNKNFNANTFATSEDGFYRGFFPKPTNPNGSTWRSEETGGLSSSVQVKFLLWS